MILISDYDPRWPERFEDLRQRLAPHVADLPVSIEHVGSTSVPGCAAKPIIDLDIVVSDAAAVPEVISRLAEQGYRHEGDLGVQRYSALKVALAQRFPAGREGRAACSAAKSALVEELVAKSYSRTTP
ncbi:GrpB family protein [Streptomyces huasconensis]|uniref:GrpB family protein n=1 Tax=Streptomyces huasconensis TaxID=1854574 RepID=A0ABV3M2S1_9ACTN